MAYKMKGFSGFKSSPAKQDKDPYTKKDYDFLKEQREERVHAMDYLTKTPAGPTADKKVIKPKEYKVPTDYEGAEGFDTRKITPGYEDPIKIQKLQREGLTPDSQKFYKKAKEKSKSPAKQDNSKAIKKNEKGIPKEVLEDMRRHKKRYTGEGFMHPPYKDTVKGIRPYEKRQGYHGYKNFETIPGTKPYEMKNVLRKQK